MEAILKFVSHNLSPHILVLFGFLVTLIACESRHNVSSLRLECLPETTSSSGYVSGSGFSFVDDQFIRLDPLGWSKVKVTLINNDNAKVEVYFSDPPSDSSIYKYSYDSKVLSLSSQKLTVFYERNSTDENGVTLDSWMLTYFMQTNAMYLSMHKFDTWYRAKANAAPLVQGYLFKALCRTVS